MKSLIQLLISLGVSFLTYKISLLTSDIGGKFVIAFIGGATAGIISSCSRGD